MHRQVHWELVKRTISFLSVQCTRIKSRARIYMHVPTTRRDGDFASQAYFYDRRRVHKAHKTNAYPSTWGTPVPVQTECWLFTTRNYSKYVRLHLCSMRVSVHTARCALGILRIIKLLGTKKTESKKKTASGR